MWIDDTFEQGPDLRWQVGQIGAGLVETRSDGLHLILPPVDSSRYHDAQIADYIPAERSFSYRPPLRMTVRAHHANGPFSGTAGFGFWNHPFVPGERGFRLPQTLWFFFGGPRSNMALALDVPGNGWKAATFDARRAAFLALLPAALPGFLLMRSHALYRRLWPIGQRAIGVHEAPLPTDMLSQTRTYTLDWLPDEAHFAVDGEPVLHVPHVPPGPLGFIAWVDNQYAVVTPQGQFSFGLVDVPRQETLILERVTLAPL